MNTEISNELALREFLLDIDCLNELQPWAGRFNIFDVLKVSRTEIRHSNMLAWLLDPTESHGIGDIFLRMLTQRIITNDQRDKYDIFQILLQDNYSFVVCREWKNIDILLYSEQDHVLLAIENKVGSHEHSNQLNRYRSILEHEFPNYERILVYLTPDGEPPSDTDNWDVLTYSDIVEILDDVLVKTEMKSDVKLLVQNYVTVIRRDIVEDQELIEICNRIYNKHRKALDLIYENRIDNANLISDTIKNALKDIAAEGKIIYQDSGKSNTYILFHTHAMDQLFGLLDSDSSSYSNNRVYAYFITIRGTSIKGYFELGGWNVTAEHKQAQEKIIKLRKPNDKKKDDFRYKRIYRTKIIQIDEESLEDSVSSAIYTLVYDLLNTEKQILKELSAIS